MLPDLMEKAIRDWCKALRKARGWTQDQLADEAKISQGLISRLEADAGYFPTVDVLGRFARAFNMALSEFFGQIEKKTFTVTITAEVSRDTKSLPVTEAFDDDQPASLRPTRADLTFAHRFLKLERALAITDAERRGTPQSDRRKNPRPRSTKHLRGKSRA